MNGSIRDYRFLQYGPRERIRAGAGGGVAVGSVGFLSGATSGAVGGFAGGFVSGAGNSWLGGGSFGDGLMAGLKTGGIGAGVGGLMGGIQGGINAKNMRLDFWDGTGTSVSEMSGSAALPSDPGEPTNIRNSQELHEFRSKNYPGSDDYVQGTFKGVDRFALAEGKGYTVENGQMYNADKEPVHGITIYERPSAFASGGKSFIGISPNMITYSNNLHAVMGHEVIHAYHYNIGFMGRYGIEASEYYAHKFSASVPHSTQEGAKLVYPTLGNRVPLPRDYVYPSWVPNF